MCVAKRYFIMIQILVEKMTYQMAVNLGRYLCLLTRPRLFNNYQPGLRKTQHTEGDLKWMKSEPDILVKICLFSLRVTGCSLFPNLIGARKHQISLQLLFGKKSSVYRSNITSPCVYALYSSILVKPLNRCVRSVICVWIEEASLTRWCVLHIVILINFQM